MARRRRWTIRAQDQAGEETWLVLEVPKDGDGLIYSSVPNPHSVLRPEDVEKIRRALAEARAQALQDRESR